MRTAKIREVLVGLVAGVVVLVGGACALLVFAGSMPVSTEIVDQPVLADVPAAEWERLSQRRIFFGHKSVGYNIMEGVADIVAEQSAIKLTIAETDDPGDFADPVLGHARVGMNGDPQSKLTAFAALMDGGLAEKVDVAFFKLCYVDVGAETDVPALFESYQQLMGELRERHPDTKFVHVTVPLRSAPTGLRGCVRGLLRRPDDNIARCRLNEMLRREYEGREPVFDLAAWEATGVDGKRVSRSVGDLAVYALVPEYTDDGGHLNAIGREKLAEQFLITLARLED